MAAPETPLPCPHCGNVEAPRVLAFRALDRFRVQVVCATSAEGCGATGPLIRADLDPKPWNGLAESQGLQLRDGCPEAQQAIAGWNVRVGDYGEFERTQEHVRAAVARRDEIWRARYAKVLAPSVN